jgi:hypothetical protein
MMPHLLVTQLRFARSELLRAMQGVSDADALVRLGPMNCLSWIVGHLANQENRYWVMLAQNLDMAPGLNDLVGFGKPASTPPLDEMWVTWRRVTAAADPYLDLLTPEMMVKAREDKARSRTETLGTMLMRNIFHYWYHIGEAMAVRQQLGHKDLPQFVGDMSKAAYTPENE